MRIATPTPFGVGTPGRLHLGHVVLSMVACGVAAATYVIAGRVAAQPNARGAPSAVVGKPLTPAMPAHEASLVAGTAGSLPAPPSAAEFTADFIALVNRYAKAHGDPVRVAHADCVQPSAGHYMCSYATTRPGNARSCHVMQALWSPRKTSTFTVTLAGRSERCGSLREALRSLK